jgi:uncharacterized protein YndB with AHSA1/START domain
MKPVTQEPTMTDRPDPSTDTSLGEPIERELRIAASPEIVYEYFVDPAKLVRWMGRSAQAEPTPGGLFRVDYNGSDIARGTYLDVEPPRRVVFSWGWEMPGDAVPPGASVVDVTLTPDGDGTIVRLRHSGLPTASIDGHAEGWDYFLPTLAATVAA